MTKMSNREGREGRDKHPHIYTDDLYTFPVEPKKSPYFLSHSLLIEMIYHDCPVIRFQWLVGPVSLCSIYGRQ